MPGEAAAGDDTVGDLSGFDRCLQASFPVADRHRRPGVDEPVLTTGLRSDTAKFWRVTPRIEMRVTQIPNWVTASATNEPTCPPSGDRDRVHRSITPAAARVESRLGATQLVPGLDQVDSGRQIEGRVQCQGHDRHARSCARCERGHEGRWSRRANHAPGATPPWFTWLPGDRADHLVTDGLDGSAGVHGYGRRPDVSTPPTRSAVASEASVPDRCR